MRFRCLFIVFSACFAVNALAGTPPELKGLDIYVHKVMKQWQVPGLAVAVVKDGKVVLAKGYGVRELGKPGKVNANTLFTIGSISKQFTVGALGTLVASNKLEWDARAVRYLKNFQLKSPYVTEHITLRDLLTHRSGYCDSNPAWYTSDDSDLIRRLRYQRPAYGFRSHFCFDNVMVLAAAGFIPAITGDSWGRYVTTHLFVPLKMSHTVTTEAAFESSPNRATRHALIDGKIERINGLWAHDQDILAPVLGISSSVNDLSHWLQMLLADGRFRGKTLLAPDVLQEIETPQQLIPSWRVGALATDSHYYANGLVFLLQDVGGHRLVSNPLAAGQGMTTAMAMVPDAHLGVVVLTNMDDAFGAPVGVAMRVVQNYLGLPRRDLSNVFLAGTQARAKAEQAVADKLAATRKPGTKAPLSLSAYVGLYQDKLDGKARVRLDHGHLVMQLGNPDFTADLVHWHDSTFRVNWRNRYNAKEFSNDYVTFDVDAYGNVKKVSFARLGAHFDRRQQPLNHSRD